MRKMFLLFLVVGLVLGGCASSKGPRVPQMIFNDYSEKIILPEKRGQEPGWQHMKEPYRVEKERPRIYPELGSFEDPTVVVFRNPSNIITYWVSVDDGEPLEVGPGKATSNQYLSPGTHKVKVWGSRPTRVFGDLPIPDRIIPVTIRVRGRARVITLY